MLFLLVSFEASIMIANSLTADSNMIKGGLRSAGKDIAGIDDNVARNSSTPCRHGHVSSHLLDSCACTYPRELQADSQGIMDCVIADCGRGNYSFAAGRCICEHGWGTAGVTNPFKYVEGQCSQYKCQTDALCSELLGIVGAICPAPGWNCDCGLMNSLHGNERAQCMYPWWALASKVTRLFWFTMRYSWIAFFAVATVMIPFGKNVVGIAEGYSFTLFSHDFAWTVFTLKLCAWSYAFSMTTYFCLAAAWVSAAALMVFFALVCILLTACFLALVTLAGEGGGAIGCGECGACGGQGVGECATCGCAEWHLCGECCTCCEATQADVGPMALYSYDPWCCYGPTPYISGPDCDCGCCCHPGCPTGRCQRCQSCFMWIPCFRILVKAFPRSPENMLGGLLGLAIGTHPLRNHYNPDSRIVTALSRPCWSLSNRGDRWRRVVYEWLHEREAVEAVGQTGETVAEARREAGSTRLIYGGVTVERDCGVFTAAERIFNFEDYEANICWICQQSDAQWDLWTACRHAFCTRCSSEMLRRRMPCPFCRVRSGHVTRRDARPLELRESAAAAEDVVEETIGSDDSEMEMLLLGGRGVSSDRQRPAHRARCQNGITALAPPPQQLPPSRT